MTPPSTILGLTLAPEPSIGHLTCDCGKIPEGEPYYIGFSDLFCIKCAIARAESLSFLAGCASQEGTGWLPIAKAEKNEEVPLLVYYDHGADPYQDPADPTRLTDYAVHAEGGDYLAGTGVALVVWREAYWQSEGWEHPQPDYLMPGAWWEYGGGDATDRVVNPVMWKPYSLPCDLVD
jgi:hypothetical protein